MECQPGFAAVAQLVSMVFFRRIRDGDSIEVATVKNLGRKMAEDFKMSPVWSFLVPLMGGR